MWVVWMFALLVNSRNHYVCLSICLILSECYLLNWSTIILWTADSLATKLGLMVHHHKPEYLVTKLDYCIQGQGHSKGSQWQWMFVQMISSKPPNMLLPNLAWWCIIMNWSVMHKNWFAARIFRVKVTAKAHMIKIWQCLLYLLNCWSFCFQIWFWWYSIYKP